MDLTGDGYGDILSGSYSPDGRKPGLYYLLQGEADDTFNKAEPLKGTDGEPLSVPAEGDENSIEKVCTRPFAVDWNGDGPLDLVVGNFAGTFYVFRGEDIGCFRPEPDQLMAGNEPLKLAGHVTREGDSTTKRSAHHSDPFVIDWDGDGDLDLLSGTSIGGVQWAENRAEPAEPPQLEPFRWLIDPGPRVEYGELLHEDDLEGPISSTRIWVEDMDGDGKLDILVGDRVTLISPAQGLSEEEYRVKLAEWQEARKAARAELNASQEDETRRQEARKRLRKLYDKRDEFMSEDDTGFVWLYRQK